MSSSEISLAQIAELMNGLRDYAGKMLVIKIGGNSIAEDAEFLPSIARQIAFLENNFVRVVLVHGGGPQIDAALAAANVPTVFAPNGRRSTSTEALAVIQTAMCAINREIAAALLQAGCPDVWIAADHADLLVTAKPMWPDNAEERVGIPVSAKADLLRDVLGHKKVPVLHCVACASDGGIFNTNADDYALAVALALKADRLLLVTKSAVLDAHKQRLSLIKPEQIAGLIADGTISGGMIPKIESAGLALQQGVGGVAILDGHPPWSLLGELLTEDGFGTLIKP